MTGIYQSECGLWVLCCDQKNLEHTGRRKRPYPKLLSRIRFVREQEKGKGEKRMDIKTILFDLDGTLTDSGEGIMNAVRYTLERYEKTATEAQLRSFIGPPLQNASSNSF